MRRYEGMFLFDTGAAREWSAIEQEIKRLYDRIGARSLVCVKFDERRLAFEIKRRKRGTYVLTYFEAPPGRITDLEHDCDLSELILRVLVLQADHMNDERLAPFKAHPPEQPWSPHTAETRRGDEDGGRGGRYGGRSEESDMIDVDVPAY